MTQRRPWARPPGPEVSVLGGMVHLAPHRQEMRALKSSLASMLAVWLSCLLLGSNEADAQGSARPVRHRLVEGSMWVDDCPPCARPIIALRMRGTFDVVAAPSEPGVQRLTLHNIDWHAPAWDGSDIRISGTGGTVIHGNGWQEMALDLRVAMGGTNLARRFTNVTGVIIRPLPNLAADMESAEKTPTQVYRLSLRSAPVRDLWFVTTHGFTPSKEGKPLPERRVAGDVLSMDGALVAGNARVTSRLGVMPMVPPLALGALDVQPGGRVLFALREPVFSETLGPLSTGTLLASDGVILGRTSCLLAPFAPVSWPDPEPGMDAVQVLGSGEMLFSLTTDVLVAGGRLSHGDILSSRGHVHRRFKETIGAMAPTPLPGTTLEDVGVDAWHEWPHGEAWFSVRRGFQSAIAGPVHAGDVLSTWGWVVYRNHELLEGFQPLEDLADFGLEGLFVLTDLWEPSPAPRLTCQPSVQGVMIEAHGHARAWQLEQARVLGGIFETVSPLTPWPRWTWSCDEGASFFRVRAW